MSDEVLTATEHRILDGIAEHGWYSQHIFFPELDEPNYTYTIGFAETLGAPEFIIFGLHRDVMHEMLAEVFRQLKAGRKLENDQRWQGLSEDYDCISRKASHPDLLTRYVPLADWHWQRQRQKGHPTIVQLVWPGLLDGLYPWDEGCKQSVIDAQTQLWS